MLDAVFQMDTLLQSLMSFFHYQSLCEQVYLSDILMSINRPPRLKTGRTSLSGSGIHLTGYSLHRNPKCLTPPPLAPSQLKSPEIDTIGTNSCGVNSHHKKVRWTLRLKLRRETVDGKRNVNCRCSESRQAHG